MSKRKLLSPLWLAPLLLSTAQAQTPTWDYPELSVSPRASERVEREAKLEARRGLDEFWQIGVPGLFNLTSGILALGATDLADDPKKSGAWSSIAIGGTWVAAAAIIPALYNPYTHGAEEISKMPRTTQREQLSRERAAEESIAAAAQAGRVLKWLAFASNLYGSIQLVSRTQSGSPAQIGGMVGIGAAFAPVVFEHRWMRVAREQKDYKKRIFSPLAGLRAVPLTTRDGAGLSLSWRF